MKTLLSTLLLFFCFSLTGQDSTWINKANQIRATAYATPTYDEMFAYLRNELSAWRKAGPITAELVELYRWTALQHQEEVPAYDKKPDLVSARLYVDTVFQLQKLASDVSLTSQAKADYLYAFILYRQELLAPSQYWFDKALLKLQQAMVNGDSLGKNQHRIQYFTTMAAMTAGHNQDFARSEIVGSAFTGYNARYRGSVGNSLSDRYLIEHLLAKGFNLQKQERFAEARAVYEQAMNGPLNDVEDAISRSNLLILRGNHANSYVEAGRYATGEILARRILTEILPLAEESTELQDRTVITYGYLLNALQGQGKYDEMAPVFNAALAMRARVDSTGKGRNLGLLYTFMAKAAAKQGLYDEADEYFEQARNAFLVDASPLGPAELPRIDGNGIYGQEEFLYFLSEYRDAYLLKANDDVPSGLTNALLTARTIDSLIYRGNSRLSLISSVGRFMGLENRHFAKGIDIALQLYRSTNDETYLHEAFGFISRQKSNLLRRYLTGPQLARSFQVPQGIIDRKVELETSILIKEKALKERNDEALRQQLIDQQQGLADLRKELERNYPSFTRALRGGATIDPQAAMNTLADDQLVVEYFLSGDSLYIFSLASNGMDYHVQTRPADLISMVGTALTNGKAANQLYDLLVAPALVDRPSIKRLQFIPDGILWRVPFAALRVDNSFLIRKQAVSYAYSSPLLFSPDNKELPAGGYLGVGISYEDLAYQLDTTGNRSAIDRQLRNLGSLPYATREIRAVQAIMEGTVKLNTEATRADFLNEADNARIIHLAVHGLLNEKNPMESALVLRGSNEFYDLLKMKDVLGSYSPKELTVLSACHSGNGPLETAEGMQSIGLAFTAAGSQSTITSMWAAQDEATADILTGTFTGLKDKMTKDIALQQAVIKYLDEATSAGRLPSNWAHLVITGKLDKISSSGLAGITWILLAACLFLPIVAYRFFRARARVQG